ncbi:MAG: hypothetical protein WBX15_17270 [Thermoanaerobaculia bacterium]
MSQTLFLLSPANLRGVRAKQLLSPRAEFSAARAYRSPDGVPIEDAFSFMSALYFRGKVAYARRFASVLDEGASGAFVIAPGFGLVPLGWRLTPERVKRLRRIPVDPRRPAYRKPLNDAAKLLAERLPSDAKVVLLGSVATGKYVDILWPLFGDRFRFPRAFAGIGDMSRGALMLRAAASGEELEYVPLDAQRSKARGARLARG